MKEELDPKLPGGSQVAESFPREAKRTSQIHARANLTGIQSDARGVAPADPDVYRMTMLSYPVVRGLAGGLALVLSAFVVCPLMAHRSSTSSAAMIIDGIALAAAAALFWLMSRRRIPVPWIRALAIGLWLLFLASTMVRAIFHADPGDLRYLAALALLGGAIAGSARRLGWYLLGTTAIVSPVAMRVCPPEQFLEFIVVQAAFSLASLVLYWARMEGLNEILKRRASSDPAAAEPGRAREQVEPVIQTPPKDEEKHHKLEEQRGQTQRLEALGTLAGGVAHDMNNVLGAITAVASNLLDELPADGEVYRELTDILTAARRGETLTHNILSFARRGPTQIAPFRVEEVVREVETLLQRTLPKNVELRIDSQVQNCWVDGEAGQIGHLLMNLCLNSADAIERHGQIVVRTQRIFLSTDDAPEFGAMPGPHIELSVSDNGRGIPPESLSKVFEPYFSTKGQNDHSGLGLSMVYGAVRQHRGGITIRSEVGRGTTVIVVLPERTDPPTQSKLVRLVKPKVDPARDRLLFVDDEPILRRAGERIAKSLGFKGLLASDGQAALELFAQHGPCIGAVVLDVAMPVMSGDECFRALRQLDATLPIVLTSGFQKDHDIEILLKDPNSRFLRKPYDRDDLAEALAHLLRRNPSSRPNHPDPSARVRDSTGELEGASSPGSGERGEP